MTIDRDSASSVSASSPVTTVIPNYYYYYYYAAFNAFNAPCVGHKDDESQARKFTPPARQNKTILPVSYQAL